MQEETFKKTQFIKKYSRKTLSHTSQLISFYTTLRLIQKIKMDLGLEAMLEYISASICSLDGVQEDLSGVVSDVLQSVDVKKIYLEVKQ